MTWPKVRKAALDPLQGCDVPALRRLAAMLDGTGRLPARVMAGVVRRIAERVESETGGTVVEIPGGELRFSSALSEEQVAAFVARFRESMVTPQAREKWL